MSGRKGSQQPTTLAETTSQQWAPDIELGQRLGTIFEDNEEEVGSSESTSLLPQKARFSQLGIEKKAEIVNKLVEEKWKKEAISEYRMKLVGQLKSIYDKSLALFISDEEIHSFFQLDKFYQKHKDKKLTSFSDFVKLEELIHTLSRKCHVLEDLEKRRYESYKAELEKFKQELEKEKEKESVKQEGQQYRPICIGRAATECSKYKRTEDREFVHRLFINNPEGLNQLINLNKDRKKPINFGDIDKEIIKLNKKIEAENKTLKTKESKLETDSVNLSNLENQLKKIQNDKTSLVLRIEPIFGNSQEEKAPPINYDQQEKKLSDEIKKHKSKKEKLKNKIDGLNSEIEKLKKELSYFKQVQALLDADYERVVYKIGKTSDTSKKFVEALKKEEYKEQEYLVAYNSDWTVVGENKRSSRILTITALEEKYLVFKWNFINSNRLQRGQSPLKPLKIFSAIHELQSRSLDMREMYELNYLIALKNKFLELGLIKRDLTKIQSVRGEISERRSMEIGAPEGNPNIGQGTVKILPRSDRNSQQQLTPIGDVPIQDRDKTDDKSDISSQDGDNPEFPEAEPLILNGDTNVRERRVTADRDL